MGLVSFYIRIRTGLFALAAVAVLASCANFAPVPGGTDSVNDACFESEEALKSYFSSLAPGMDEGSVLSSLCRKKEDIARIDRRDIRIALLGGDNIPFPPGDDLIGELYGYRLHYKSVRRRHGFTSPIRIRTDETGFDYTVMVIFREGRLFAKPAVSGGPVRNSSTGTLFDFLTLGTIIDHAVP